jgi:hypothetical protein
MNRDTFVADILNALVPERPEIKGDWDSVLVRAGVAASARRESARRLGLGRQLRTRFFTRRRIIVIAAAALALTASTLALGATEGWWFTTLGPTPAGQPVIVTQGSWNGQAWTLSAYRSEDDQLCYGLAPGSPESNPSGEGGAKSCIPTSELTGGGLSITGLVAGEQGTFPPFVTGPVANSAVKVQVEFPNQAPIQVQTLPTPAVLDLPIRFYAIPLPCGESPTKVVGLGEGDAVVAQLNLEQRPANLPANLCK